jgi:hypothetical protein
VSRSGSEPRSPGRTLESEFIVAADERCGLFSINSLSPGTLTKANTGKVDASCHFQERSFRAARLAVSELERWVTEL